MLIINSFACGYFVIFYFNANTLGKSEKMSKSPLSDGQLFTLKTNATLEPFY